VWGLLEEAYRRTGPVPTCLERDTNIPELEELVGELAVIAEILRRTGVPAAKAA